jgi:acyl-CoA thioesterase FadM
VIISVLTLRLVFYDYQLGKPMPCPDAIRQEIHRIEEMSAVSPVNTANTHNL